MKKRYLALLLSAMLFGLEAKAKVSTPSFETSKKLIELNRDLNTLSDGDKAEMTESIGKVLDSMEAGNIVKFRRGALDTGIKKSKTKGDLNEFLDSFSEKHDKTYTKVGPAPKKDIVKVVEEPREEQRKIVAEGALNADVMKIMNRVGIRSTQGQVDRSGKFFTDKGVEGAKQAIKWVLEDVRDGEILPPVLSKQTVINEMIERLRVNPKEPTIPQDPKNLKEVMERIDKIYTDEDNRKRLAGAAVEHEKKLDQKIAEAESEMKAPGLREKFLDLDPDKYLSARTKFVKGDVLAQARTLMRNPTPEKTAEFQKLTNSGTRSGAMLLKDNLKSLKLPPKKYFTGDFYKPGSYDVLVKARFFQGRNTASTEEYLILGFDARGLRNFEKLITEIEEGKLEIYMIENKLSNKKHIYGVPTGGTSFVTPGKPDPKIWMLTARDKTDFTTLDLKLLTEIYEGKLK